MKTLIAVMLGALTLLVQSKQAEPKKSKPDVGAGKIAWFDLTTTNLAKSKDFYGKLFGWTFTATPGAEAFAAEIQVGDMGIGTIRVAEGAISNYNGVVYVQVDDLPATCKKAQALGGTVPPGFPFDLDDGRGAIGLAVDPVGHPIGMYSKTLLAEGGSKPAGK